MCILGYVQKMECTVHPATQLSPSWAKCGILNMLEFIEQQLYYPLGEEKFPIYSTPKTVK